MRYLPVACVIVLAGALAAPGAIAQQGPPPKLEPLPEPPPPPVVRDGADEPRVRIAPQEGDKVEEVRDGSGRVFMLRVTPPNGPPYYLVDTSGTGDWVKRNTLDPGLRVPQWTIRTFD